MKLAIFLTIFVVGLTVQVRNVKSRHGNNLVSVQLQSNGVDAIFWQFIRPFIPGGGVVISSNTPASNSGSSPNSSAPTASSSNMSAGDLTDSNAIFASNSNVSANINQTFNAPANSTA